jgi:hypothetical protein
VVIPKAQRAEGSGAEHLELTMAQYSAALPFLVYNEVQLSLTHKQLKVGTANQRTPLTSSESSQHNLGTEKGTKNGRNRNSKVV